MTSQTKRSKLPYLKRNKKLRKAGYATYQEYLNSKHWKRLRRKVFKRDGYRCVSCKARAECVHHTKYSERVLFGTEPTCSLVSLCNSCHQFIEFNKDGSKTRLSKAMEKLRELCRTNGTHLPGRCKSCMKGGVEAPGGYCGKCRRRLKDP